MSQRDATRSLSATSLGNNNNGRASSNIPIMQSFKRSRQQLEPDTNIPTITLTDDGNLESASTETVIAAYQSNQTDNEGLQSNPGTGSNHGRYLVSKLDRLHDKKERYTSHQQFLQKCLDNNIIPNGLRLDLEPTIGNHDEEFLHNWYSKLEEYSKNFMRDVLAFCAKTNDETETSIASVNTELQATIEKEQYDNVQATVIQNNSLRSNELQRKKNKKFYALKYKKETPRQHQNYSRGGEHSLQNNPGRGGNMPREANNHRENNQRENNTRHTTPPRMTTVGRSYAAVTTGQNSIQNEAPRRSNSRQNLSRRNSFHATDAPLHQQISLQRKRSFRRDGNNDEQQIQSDINRLQSRLDEMRSKAPDQGNHYHPRNTGNLQKNMNTTQSSGMGANQETVIKEAFTFVTNAMATLKQFETKFATLLNTHGTQPDRS